MRAKSGPALCSLLWMGIIACKTPEVETKKATKPATSEIVPSGSAVAAPSTHSKGPGDLVAPGSDEALVSRGPNARCPTAVEVDALERVIMSLGEETVDLVKEDLANLRQTLSRNDAEGIASCCNQLEQMVQDVEIMNEEKASATSGVDAIRKVTLKLCPSGL